MTLPLWVLEVVAAAALTLIWLAVLLSIVDAIGRRRERLRCWRCDGRGFVRDLHPEGEAEDCPVCVGGEWPDMSVAGVNDDAWERWSRLNREMYRHLDRVYGSGRR